MLGGQLRVAAVYLTLYSKMYVPILWLIFILAEYFLKEMYQVFALLVSDENTDTKINYR